ncbi:MAG: hypothetical protein ACI8QF_004132, partial [Limisphaerales bacterium]
MWKPICHDLRYKTGFVRKLQVGVVGIPSDL